MRPLACLSLAILIAGCGSGGNETSADGVTIDLPPAVKDAPAAEAASANAVTPAKAEEPPPAPPASPPEKEAAETKSPPPSRPAEKASAPKETAPAAKAPATAEPKAAPKAAAARSSGPRPPLADSLIASTIRRIGYACPEVSATSALDAEPETGAPRYRITCTSGDSYRATNRNGRLTFRRLSD